MPRRAATRVTIRAELTRGNRRGGRRVLAALLVAGPVTEPRFVDVSENSLYWYFIVLWWVPIYLTI